MGDLLSLYHRAPYPLRVLAASARGYYLRWWRYDRATARLVEEAVDREGWSRERLRAWHEARLARTLHLAATRVPAYRRQWELRRRRGDRASWEVLAHWPVLDKEQLRVRPADFLADGARPRALFREHTSGTTGKPVEVWHSRDTLLRWYALYEARIRRWNDVRPGTPWGMLGGQLVAPFAQTRPPFWVWNRAFSQLYLSSYHLRLDQIQAYLDAMRAHGVAYVIGYASSMHTLAQGALELALDAPRLQVAISNAEPFFRHQREALARAFGCATRDTYGMTEIVAGASECPHGRMHLWPEVGALEVLEDGSAAAAADGEIGRFVCTGLLNDAMPLVRYEVGDRGAVANGATGATPCACGRTLPTLRTIEGRLDDVVVTPDGRRVGRLDPVFKSDLPIREAQIVQEALDALCVRYVPAAGFSARDGAALTARLRQRVGDMTIRLEAVPALPRTANGKLRTVVSMLPAERRGAGAEVA